MMAADIRQGYVTDRDLVESWYQVAYSRYYGVPLAAATGRGAKTSLRWKPSVIEDFIRAQPEA